MRSKEGGYTPKEAAYDITMGWINAAARGATGDVEQYDDRQSYQREVRRQLALLHNRLFDKSGLDGSHIDIDDLMKRFR